MLQSFQSFDTPPHPDDDAEPPLRATGAIHSQLIAVGSAALEYALILALVSVVVMAALRHAGVNLSAVFVVIATSL